MSRVALLLAKKRYTQRVLATRRASLLAYWPLAELSGTAIVDVSGNGRGGTYTAVTLGQPGIGDGRTAASLNGTTSYGNVYSAGLAGAFSGATGTLLAWMKVASAGVWTDTKGHYVAQLGADDNNRALFYKEANNNLSAFYIAGGTAKKITVTITDTGWVPLVLTWDKPGDAFKFFTQGTLANTLGALGVWVGSLGASRTMIGSYDPTPVEPWSGWLAHVGPWNVALTPTEIAALARVN